MKNYHLGIIGCGNMSQAIIKALCNEETKQNMADAGFTIELSVSDQMEEKLHEVKSFGVKTTMNNSELLKSNELILLAVKPQSAASALNGLDFNDKVVVSIMAGTSLLKLKELAKNGKYVRVMPNLNARVGLSFNAFAYNDLTADEEKIVRLILSSFGTATRVEESKMNAITGLTGSAPAFVFQFIESFVDAGINNGFDPLTARQMALATIIGSAKLVENNENIALKDLIDSVCSKGGTTIEGVNYLNEMHFNETVQTAVQKSIRRSEELEAGV